MDETISVALTLVRLGSFDIIGKTGWFWDWQSILTHAANVKFNRFTHALSQLLDGFPCGDTSWQVRQVS